MRADASGVRNSSASRRNPASAPKRGYGATHSIARRKTFERLSHGQSNANDTDLGFRLVGSVPVFRVTFR